MGADPTDARTHLLDMYSQIFETEKKLLAVPGYTADNLTILWDPPPEKLNQLFTANTVIALDTEFSIEENLSQRKLAYIQIGFLASNAVCILTHKNKFVGFGNAFFKWLEQDSMLIGFFIHPDLALLWQYFSAQVPLNQLMFKIFDLYAFFKYLHNGYKNRHSLAHWAARLLDMTLDKKFQKTDWFAVNLDNQLRDYLIQDVISLHRLMGYVQRVAGDTYTNTWTGAPHTYLTTSYLNEQSLIPGLVDMTLRGIAISEDNLSTARGQCEKHIEKGLIEMGLTLEEYRSSKQFTERLESAPPSPLCGIIQDWPRTRGEKRYLSRSKTEIKSWMSRYTADSRFQSATTLEWFKNFFVVSKYEGIAKFLNGVQAQMSNGKIYPLWDLMGGDTGRITAKNPPLHSTPRDPLARSVIIPSRKHSVFVIADYKTIELVIQAILAKETTMLEVFQTNRDLHTFLAAQVYPQYTYESLMELKKTNPSKYKELRSTMKGVNFGLVYGMGAPTLWDVLLSQEQALPFKTANLLHTTWGRTFPKIREYQNRCRNNFYNSVADLPYPLAGSPNITSMLGHIRRPLIPVDPTKKPFINMTQIINFPIQSTCTDFLKFSLTRLWLYLQQSNLHAHIVLSAHDEIVVECHHKEVAHLKRVMVQIMISSAQYILHPLYPKAPVGVDTGIGHSWADKP